MGTRGMLATDFSRPSALLCCTFAQKTYRLKGFTATSRHFCHRQKRPYRFIPTALHELTDRVRAHCGALYSLQAATQVCQRDTCLHQRAPFQSRPSFFPLHRPRGRKTSCASLFFFFSLSLSLHAKDSPIFAGILPSQRTSPTNVSRSRTQGLCIHAQWNLTLGKQPALLDRRSCGGRGERVKSKVGSVSHPRSPAKIKNAKQFSGASQQAFKRLSISPHTLCLFSGSWKHPCLFGFLLFFCASTTKYFTGVYFFRGSEYSGGFLHQMLTFCKKGLGTQFTGTT